MYLEQTELFIKPMNFVCKITNFKITFEIINFKIETLKNIPGIFESKKSLIFTFGKIKCTFYPNNKNKKLNATGIKTLKDIKNLLQFLQNYNINISHFKVDNTTFNIDFKRKINLDKTALNIYKIKGKYSYNKEKFSGLFYYKEFKNEGTALIFKNGKVTILGCNEFEKIKKKCKRLIRIVHFV